MTISALSHDVWRKPTYVILIIGNLTITVRLPLNLYQNVSLYHSYWFKLYINNFESLWERHCISIVLKYNVWFNIRHVHLADRSVLRLIHILFLLLCRQCTIQIWIITIHAADPAKLCLTNYKVRIAHPPEGAAFYFCVIGQFKSASWQQLIVIWLLQSRSKVVEYCWRIPLAQCSSVDMLLSLRI